MRQRSNPRFGVLAIVGIVVLCTDQAVAQLRVVTWNVTNYSSGRVADFQTAIYGTHQGRSLAPDVLIGQEFLSQTGVNNFLGILNTATGSPGDWAAANSAEASFRVPSRALAGIGQKGREER